MLRHSESLMCSLDLENWYYAPAGMLSFMAKLQKETGGSSVPTILSTHPATKDRIVALKKQIDPQTDNVGGGLNGDVYRQKIKASL